MANLEKNDFVEIEFTGSSSDEVFDTTSKEIAKKMGLDADVKPLIVSIGNEMLINGFDEALKDKQIGKDYSIVISPEKGFGKRNPQMIKTMPLKIFHEKKLNPYPGLTVQMDNYIAKILSVSGGRVSVDFNNPLAGKELKYDFKILRKVDDYYEKVNALMDFFLKTRLEFVIKDRLVIFNKPEIKSFLDIFAPKFKEITGLDFIVEEKKEEKKADLKEKQKIK